MKNICKFIEPSEKGSIIINNFIFESYVPHSGESLTHTSFLMYLVSSGEGLFKTGGYTYKITAGMILFSFPNVPVIIENTDNLNY